MTDRLALSPTYIKSRLLFQAVFGVGVQVGNGVGEGRGVGVTRRVDTSVSAMPSAMLRTTKRLMIQMMMRFRFSLELRTVPPVAMSTMVIISQPEGETSRPRKRLPEQAENGHFSPGRRHSSSLQLILICSKFPGRGVEEGLTGNQEAPQITAGLRGASARLAAPMSRNSIYSLRQRRLEGRDYVE